MFTGIVEELGEIVDVARIGDGEGAAARITVQAPTVTTGARTGDSIAVNGVCLTVAELHDVGGTFTADVMGETLSRTTLGRLAAGTPVNLERAATLGSRLGGHLVQGHVDGVGHVLDRRSAEHWDVLHVEVPARLTPYLAEKGSVALDGVSLTVVEVRDRSCSFTVGLIPETLARTTLGRRATGDPLNLEVDVIAKYVDRLLGHRAPPSGTDRKET